MTVTSVAFRLYVTRMLLGLKSSKSPDACCLQSIACRLLRAAFDRNVGPREGWHVDPFRFQLVLCYNDDVNGRKIENMKR